MDSMVEAVVQKRCQEEAEEEKGKLLSVVMHLSNAIFQEAINMIGEVLDEIDSFYISSGIPDLFFNVYCITKDLDYDTTLKLRNIERKIQNKFPFIDININEGVKGNEDLIPSSYTKVYPS